MLDSEIINLAERQIKLACDIQNESLESEIGKIRAELSRRGMIRSSNHVLMVLEACVNATTKRGEFIWTILHRCITTVGISYDDSIEQQLKSAFDKHFPDHMSELKYRVKEAASLAGMQNIPPNLLDGIEKAGLAIISKTHTEIELFLMKLKKAPSENSYIPPQINIHNSSIGALQTGSGATANVSQQIDSSAMQEVIKALLFVQEKLSSVETLPQNNKSEIIELVGDGIGELKKEKPNLTKVKSFLSSIGEAIGAVANLKPAYEMLKVAAVMVGLNLPDL